MIALCADLRARARRPPRRAPRARARRICSYGQTTSLCETCLELVPAKIIAEDGRVFYQKRCPEHGVQKTLIADDLAYWKTSATG